jgi:hypothetical protein
MKSRSETPEHLEVEQTDEESGSDSPCRASGERLSPGHTQDLAADVPSVLAGEEDVGRSDLPPAERAA